MVQCCATGPQQLSTWPQTPPPTSSLLRLLCHCGGHYQEVSRGNQTPAVLQGSAGPLPAREEPRKGGVPGPGGPVRRILFPTCGVFLSFFSLSHTHTQQRTGFSCKVRNQVEETEVNLEAQLGHGLRCVTQLCGHWDSARRVSLKGRRTMLPCSPRKITAGHASSRWAAGLRQQRHGNVTGTAGGWTLLLTTYSQR